MFFLGVAVGGWLGLDPMGTEAFPWMRLFVAMGSAGCIGAGGNALNDALDVDADRLNRPKRPLPSGQLTVRAAWWLWMTLTLAGLTGAVLLSWGHAGLAAGAAGLLVLYNARLKHVPVAGNVLVATLVAVLLVYGALAVGRPGPAWVGAGFAFLTTWAREVIKDIEDASGDAGVGGRTLPLVVGAERARRWAVVLLAVTVVLTPVPFLWMEYQPAYLMGVLVADAFLLASAWALVAPERPVEGTSASSALLKLAMVAGLAALGVAA